MDLESDSKFLSPLGRDVLTLLEAIHERLDGIEKAVTHVPTWEVRRLPDNEVPGPERTGVPWEPFAASAGVIWWRRRVAS